MSPTAAEATHLGEMVPLSALFPSPLNPRKRFPESELRDLAANIEKHGVIVPLLGRRGRTGKVEVIDGERRYRAASIVANANGGLEHFLVPLVFRDGLTDGEVIEIQLLSAIQRQDLTPLEEAAGFKALIASNTSKYSVEYIADRIGRSVKWVWDRMKLLDLIPELKQLLEAERILVGHAELLAKLKPEDQKRALEPPQRFRGVDGLWQDESDRLHLDDRDEEPTAKNLYQGLKPVTVKELESWIAHHVRFDVKHMAASAPLEFGDTATAVEVAKAEPGRGKKVISITHEYRVDDDAKDPSERTFGAQSWHRADGQEKSATCDHSVLGVFVAGRDYGKTLQVCVNRDKCTVHFGKEIKEREKNQKLRAQGKGGQAAQREKKAEESYDARWKREAAERKAREEAWAKLSPHLEKEALAQVKGTKALTAPQAKYFEKQFEIMINPDHCKGFTWWSNLPLALLTSEIRHITENVDTFDQFVKDLATPLGLNVKKLAAIRDQHAPKVQPGTPPAATKTTPANGKKAKKR